MLPEKSKIIAIRKENEKNRSIVINKSCLPGQYFAVSLLGLGEEAFPVTEISKDGAKLTYETTTIFGKNLNNLRENDTIYIRGPLGDPFNFEELKAQNLVFFVENINITNVICLLEEIYLNSHSFGEVYLFILNRDPNILFSNKIELFKKKFRVFLSNSLESLLVTVQKTRIPSHNARVILSIFDMDVFNKITQMLDNKELYIIDLINRDCFEGRCKHLNIRGYNICKNSSLKRLR